MPMFDAIDAKKTPAAKIMADLLNAGDHRFVDRKFIISDQQAIEDFGFFHLAAIDSNCKQQYIQDLDVHPMTFTNDSVKKSLLESALAHALISKITHIHNIHITHAYGYSSLCVRVVIVGHSKKPSLWRRFCRWYKS